LHTVPYCIFTKLGNQFFRRYFKSKLVSRNIAFREKLERYFFSSTPYLVDGLDVLSQDVAPGGAEFALRAPVLEPFVLGEKAVTQSQN
jgi:hypothetical protein